MVGGIPEGKSSMAFQTDLAADEIDNLVSEVEECRRQYKILTENLESKKDLKRELNAEDMLRDDESVKFYTGLPNLACSNFTLGLIQPYTHMSQVLSAKRVNGSTILGSVEQPISPGTLVLQLTSLRLDLF